MNQQIIEDNFKQMEQILLTANNPKALKALALARNIVDFSNLVVERVKLTAPKPKRIFGKIDRKTKRFKKFDKALHLIQNQIGMRMSFVEHVKIASQPLPKFPKGWGGVYATAEVNNGAYVGDTGKEEIIHSRDLLSAAEMNVGKYYKHSQLGNYPYPPDSTK